MSWMFVQSACSSGSVSTVAAVSSATAPATEEKKDENQVKIAKFRISKGIGRGRGKATKPFTTWIGWNSYQAISSSALTKAIFAIVPSYSADWSGLVTIYDEFRLDELKFSMDCAALTNNGAGATSVALAYDLDGISSAPAYGAVLDYANVKYHVADAAHGRLDFKTKVSSPEVTSSGVIIPKWQDIAQSTNYNWGVMVFANAAVPTSAVNLQYMFRVKVSFRSRR